MIRYTKAEEIWNAWSHAAGIALGVVVGVIFLVICYRGDNSWARAGVILYLFGMIASYAASTAYHATRMRSKWKERLRKWDHAAIYWHIAGSYSPLTLVALRQEVGCSKQTSKTYTFFAYSFTSFDNQIRGKVDISPFFDMAMPTCFQSFFEIEINSSDFISKMKT